MPNFQTDTISSIDYPFTCNDVSFEWEVSSGNESLIFTRYKNESFFLKRIKRDKNILVKGDKLAKPSRVKFLQDALKAYEKATKSKPVFSNINSKKNRLEKDSEFFKNLDFFGSDFREYGAKFDDIYIEIGFGSGRHLLHSAKKNPNILHVGVEIHKPSIEQVVKQLKLQDIKNILVIDCDGRILMEFFASNSVQKIFVHFPIPWDKKPHRRVISKGFTDEAKRVLKENGTLELRTDSDKFFEYSFGVFMEYLHVDLKISKNKELEISSKYEDRWKKMQKNIYDLTLINKEISDEKKVPEILSFSFGAKENKIKKQTHLANGWFVHFETCFEINEKDFLWRVAFGDTLHVEHCYILFSEKNISYFPKNIYATKNNLLAHKFISERIK